MIEASEVNGSALKAAIETALESSSLSPWPVTYAELFTYKNSTLVIARPLPPLRSHPSAKGLRLGRKSRI